MRLPGLATTAHNAVRHGTGGDRAASGPSLEPKLRFGLGLAATVYLVGVSIYLVLSGGWPTPDFLIPPLLLIAVAAGRGWTFLIDWLPFLLLVLVYEGFRGVADNVNQRVHYESLIRGDEWLFGAGQSGPNFLQAHFYHPDGVRWYDWAASVLYSAHYVAPVILGFVLWLKSRALYWRFVVTLLTLFFAGFITFYLYPAAPPWLAADQGLIPPVERILVHTLSALPATQPFALAYQRFSPNEVAAMPSLHAGAPMLIALVATSIWGKKALPLFAYPLVGGFAWVYLGEHYFVDVVAGWLYGIATFALIWSSAIPLGAEFVRRRLLPSQRLTRRPSRWVPAWPLALAALAFIAYVWVDPLFRVPLHPSNSGQAAATASLGPEGDSARPNPGGEILSGACGDSAPGVSFVDDLLQPLPAGYGAYLIGLDVPQCFAIGVRGLPPPDSEELDAMQADHDTAGSEPISLWDEPSGVLTVLQAGGASETFQQIAGGQLGDRYAVVVRADTSDFEAEISAVVGQVAAIVFER